MCSTTNPAKFMFYLKIFRIPHLIVLFLMSGNFIECKEKDPEAANNTEANKFVNWNSMVVTASAYNSLESQGVGNVNLTAFGDTLVPGMKSIAVSHDLIQKGLSHNTKVKIQGLEGVYVVNDKMHSRWKNKIDIYMGTDQKKALTWGRKKVEICFPLNDSDEVQLN